MTEDTTEETDEKSLIEAAGEMVGDLADVANGIPPPLKKGFLKAFSQLGTAWLEGKAIEIKATSEAKAMLKKGIAKKILETGQVPEEYTQLAMEQQSRTIVRKRLNLDKILQRTKGFLQQDKEEAVHSHPEEISEDWLNFFEDIAENVTSEEMQIRFAKILASEIKKPSSFSIKSVKMLSEIDSQTASLFVQLCSCCVGLKHLNENGIPYYHDVRLVPIDGSLGNNSLAGFGLGYDQLTRLQEYSLVGTDLNSRMPYRDSIVPHSSKGVGNPLFFQHKPYILRQVEDNLKQIHEFKLTGVKLTRAGTELYSIIDMTPQTEYIDELKKYFIQQKLKMESVKPS